MKKNDLYMISGTEYKEMTKEILAQSDLWGRLKKGRSEAKRSRSDGDRDQAESGVSE